MRITKQNDVYLEIKSGGWTTYIFFVFLFILGVSMIFNQGGILYGLFTILLSLLAVFVPTFRVQFYKDIDEMVQIRKTLIGKSEDRFSLKGLSKVEVRKKYSLNYSDKTPKVSGNYFSVLVFDNGSEIPLNFSSPIRPSLANTTKNNVVYVAKNLADFLSVNFVDESDSFLSNPMASKPFLNLLDMITMKKEFPEKAETIDDSNNDSVNK